MAQERIGIIFGGLSPEREVSLNSGRHVHSILDRARFESVPLFLDLKAQFWRLPLSLIVQNTTKDIEARLNEAVLVPYEDLPRIIDRAFPITFGAYGEDGCLQGLLRLLGIPFVGSDVLGASLGQDKAFQRILLRHYNGIAIPPYIVIQSSDDGREATEAFGYPMVVKPSRGGSTIGVTVVESLEQWAGALKTVFEYDTIAIVEPWLEGIEFSCLVMEEENGPRALQPTQTVHQSPIFTYNEKYMPGASNKITPARVPPETIATIQSQCEGTFRALELHGYARIDGFVLRSEVRGQRSEVRNPLTSFLPKTPYPPGTVLITDPNVYSGMSPSSWTFHQAAHENWNPTEFMTKLIETIEQKSYGQ